RLVGDAPAADDDGLEAEPLLHLRRLRTAAVDDDQPHADVRDERDVLGERAQRLAVGRDLAPELHDHRRLLVVPQVRQRLLQEDDVVHARTPAARTRLAFWTK